MKHSLLPTSQESHDPEQQTPTPIQAIQGQVESLFYHPDSTFSPNLMANHQVVIVTGSNRGIGKGIVSLLAQQNFPQPLIIYATSRSGAESNPQPSNHNQIIHAQLDITSTTSIASLFALLHTNNHNPSILINNAAISNDYRENPQFAAETISTNYLGTRNMCLAFLSQPNLGPNPRIVNLSSGYNALSTYPPPLQAQFRSASCIADVDTLSQSYLSSLTPASPAQETAQWVATRSYKVSKALINALTIVLANTYPDVLVNCCCPGWVDTQMGRQGTGTPPKTVEEGARTAVRCVVGDLGESGDGDGGLGRETERLSGIFFENEGIMSKGWGRGKVWLDT
ncbi:hypothetical protein IAQ61_003322 [Plenodomus lingam]|nr:hypothetical protein IAQ61_003322 [Plenodomus lingam]